MPRCHVATMGMTMMMMVMMMMMTGMMVERVEGAFNEPDWGFQSYLDENFTLVCDHPTTLKVQPHNHVEWKLPDGQMVEKSRGRYQLTSGLRGSVTNMYLIIQNVQEADAGVYVCYVYRSIRKEEKRGQLLRGLNLGGPKYREPFDEYRENLMVGGLAALVLFVPLVTACCVYKFRYQTKEERRAKHAARLENTKHQRYLASQEKGTALSEVAVTVDKGESNPAYSNTEAVNTHL